MTVQLPASQSKLINKIACQNGFTDDFEVSTAPGTIKGDNYIGVINKVAIKNKERKLEIILKSASTSEAFRKEALIRNVFCREVYIYETIFVEFEKFQEEFNISYLFTGHPKLYGTSLEDGQEFLVMENLLETGHKLWNRKIPMDAEHIKAVIIEYAKFHSISLAMAHTKPKLFHDLTKDLEKYVYGEKFQTPETWSTMVESIIKTVSEIFENDKEMLEVGKKMAKTLPDYFSKEMENSKWNLVVNHGDCWCNNMMFKYKTSENNKEVSEVCILDWQVAKMGSPAVDLTYFFLSHSPKEVLYDYKNYLKLYHDTVSKNLRGFSCDPEEVFPYSLLEQHWKKFINFGLCTALMVIKMMNTDSEDAPDIIELVESGKDLMASFSFNLKNSDGYYQRVKDLMKFAVDTELI